MGDPTLLLKLCSEAVQNPEWFPRDNVTHCNSAADYIAAGMGCKDFRRSDGTPLTADEMHWLMRADVSRDRWRPVTIAGTWLLADQGSLLFGSASSLDLGEGHGHISVVIPGQPVWSGHWNSMAPLCANVGKENFMGRPMSFAFRSMPDFYVWIPSLEKINLGGNDAALS